MRQGIEFIETGLWSSVDYDTGEYLEDNYSIDDVSEDFKNEADDFVNNFMEKAREFFTESELNNAPIKHDLWLTVEGHGAGFWDGDYKQGDKLTEIVKSLQPHDSHWSDLLNESLKREGES